MKLNKKSVAVIFVLLTVSIAGWFLVFQNDKNEQLDKEQFKTVKQQEVVKQNKKELNNQIEDKTEDQKIKELINSLPETSLEELGFKKLNMSKWKTYRNEEFGFEVKYPQNWTFGEGHKALKPRGFSKEIVDVVFNAPGDTPGGGTWAVTFLDNALSTIEKEIEDSGSQFNDRMEERNVIKFQNRDCILVSVTSEQNKWISRNMFCPYQGKIFKIYLDKGGYFQGFKFLK